MNPHDKKTIEEDRDYSKPINALKTKLMAMKRELSAVQKAHAKMEKEEAKEKEEKDQAPTPDDHKAALAHFKTQYMNAKRNKDEGAASEAAREYHDYSNKLAGIYQKKLKEDVMNPYKEGLNELNQMTLSRYAGKARSNINTALASGERSNKISKMITKRAAGVRTANRKMAAGEYSESAMNPYIEWLYEDSKKI